MQDICIEAKEVKLYLFFDYVIGGHKNFGLFTNNVGSNINTGPCAIFSNKKLNLKIQ